MTGSTAGTGRTLETSLWHGMAHMPSVKRSERSIVRGEGAYVWDESGHRALDLPAGLWYCNVGHGRREIAAAVAKQMATLASYSTFQQYATPPAIELAARLAELAPIDGAKVFFTSGGSDAVELACKLVRRYWTAVGRPEKRVIVTRERCYHGLHGFGTSIAGLPANRAGYGPLLDDVTCVPHDDWRALERLLADGGAERVAAFVCEPIIGTGGVLPPAPGYLAAVQRLCREHDVLLVVDEVITGFGRTGELFATTRFRLDPDVLLFAKGITSGYQPLGGALVGARVAEPFWADGSELVLRHGLTYQGHASACAAGLANLAIIEREDLVARARALEAVLAEALKPLVALAAVREVRAGVGLLAGVVMRDVATAAAVAERCWERGVLTRQIADGDVLHVSPPFVIEESQLRWAAEELGAAIDSVERGAAGEE
jgi:adenosylmethionine-8-amino-7-oxononanoate aminotransferase